MGGLWWNQWSYRKQTGALNGHAVLIIPDIIESAVNVIYDKISLLISMGINAKVWDKTNGKTNEELKTEGIYNDNLEDVFREIKIGQYETIQLKLIK